MLNIISHQGNANQNHNGIYITTAKMAIIKKKKKKNHRKLKMLMRDF